MAQQHWKLDIIEVAITLVAASIFAIILLLVFFMLFWFVKLFCLLSGTGDLWQVTIITLFIFHKIYKLFFV